MSEGNKPEPRTARPPSFLHKLLRKKVIVRTLDGKQVTGTIQGYNNYEIRLELLNGVEWLIYKHAIMCLEYPGGTIHAEK